LAPKVNPRGLIFLVVLPALAMVGIGWRCDHRRAE